MLVRKVLQLNMPIMVEEEELFFVQLLINFIVTEELTAVVVAPLTLEKMEQV